MCVLIRARAGSSPLTNLQHECVRRVDEDGRVVARRGLQAELSVGGLGVVGEAERGAQLPVVQDLLVVVRQVGVALPAEPERALGREGACGRHMTGVRLGAFKITPPDKQESSAFNAKKNMVYN